MIKIEVPLSPVFVATLVLATLGFAVCKGVGVEVLVGALSSCNLDTMSIVPTRLSIKEDFLLWKNM